MSEAIQNAATRQSLRNVHYAILESDTKDGVLYEDPVPLVGAISASVSPTTNTETLPADDGPFDVANGLGDITLEMALAVLPLEKQAALLGHKYKNGVMVKKDTDEPPYVAIGFMSKERNDDRITLRWLYKGKFALVQDEYATATDTPEWRQPKLSATFVKRVYDGEWDVIADTSATDFDPTVAQGWFTEVYEDTEG